VHVNDIAQAHWRALESMTHETHATYNVGTGHPASVMDVVRACENAAGLPIARHMSPRREGDAPALAADGTKLRKELGWTPRYETIDAIAATAWAWHSSHPGGYERSAEG
jgi:UDP-glucose 4-epimerase